MAGILYDLMRVRIFAGLLLMSTAGASFAQDALPKAGVATPWLDLQSVSSGTVETSSAAAEAAASAVPAGPPPLELNWDLLQADYRVLRHLRDGLLRTNNEAGDFERDAWLRALDYASALDMMELYYGKFSVQAPAAEKDKTVRYVGSYLAYYAALMAQTKWAIAWSERTLTEKEKERPWLEEAQPDLGLPAGSFSRLQRHLSRLRRENTLARAAERYVGLRDAKEREWFWLKKEIEPIDSLLSHDSRRLVDRAKLTASDETDWEPSGSWIGQWLEADLTREDLEWVITQSPRPLPDDQVLNLADELEPGDLLVARRTPFRGDVGIPGYWNFAGIYIGTPEERKRFFGNDTMETQLRNRFPKAYALTTSAEKPPIRVMVAGLEGAGFASLERVLRSDACAAIRPRLTKIAKAEALLKAFSYAGKPYDDSFNADSEDGFTGAKLAFKAYEGRIDRPGLQFNLEKMFGHRVVGANDIAKKFDAEFGLEGGAQQMDFVWYVENVRGGKKPNRLTLEEFRSSWRRPKWAFPVRKNEESERH